MKNFMHPETLGVMATKAPGKVFIIFSILLALTAYGFFSFQSDDSLSELFRSESQQFKTFESLSHRYPSSEYDVLIVLEAKDLLTAKRIEAMRTLAIGLNFVESANGITSIFSAQRLPNEEGEVLPLVPETIPEGRKLKKLKTEILTNKIVGEKLISKDASLALIVMALDKTIVKAEGLEQSIASIKGNIADMLKGSDITYALAGVPVMQLEIRNTVTNDRILYNSLGFILGALICYLFFRRLTFVILAITPPAIAIMISLGTIGMLGIKLNMFLNVIIPLIMVIAFSDSMHMVFSIRRELLQGRRKREAILNTLKTVGVACVLTSVLTAIALFSLVFSSSAMIKTFGLAAGFSTLVAFFVIITIIPALGIILLNDNPEKIQSLKKHDKFLDYLEVQSSSLFQHLKNNTKNYALGSIVITLITGLFFILLEPQYKLADQVPDKEQAIQASNKLDRKLTGANPVHVLIEWPKSTQLYSEKTLDVISQVHKIVESHQAVGNVWSVEMLRRWLNSAGKSTMAQLKEYVSYFPAHLSSRFLEKNGTSAVVTGRVPDLDIQQLLPVIKQLDASLDTLRKTYPQYRISLTGLAVISSYNSASMIKTLSFNLIVTILIIVTLLAILYRSAYLGFLILLPNLLPIFATATLLYIMGVGLQFASVIALTVAFGLSVDNAIHFIHRLKAEEKGTLFSAKNIHHTMKVVGPVIILTMIVLALGMGVTIFSGLPSLRLFGGLNAMTLLFSMVAVLMMLPAILMYGRAYFDKK